MSISTRDTVIKLSKISRKSAKNLRKWSNMWSSAKNGLVQPSKQGRTSPMFTSRKNEHLRENKRK